MLHITSKERTCDEGKEEGKVEAAVQDAIISVQTSGLTGAGVNDCIRSILPVRVKSKKALETFVTYAFLDPGSSVSFCTKRLMKTLKLIGRKTDILLRTMGQEKIVPIWIVSDLEVAGLHEEPFYDLPSLFTKEHASFMQTFLCRKI